MQSINYNIERKKNVEERNEEDETNRQATKKNLKEVYGKSSTHVYR